MCPKAKQGAWPVRGGRFSPEHTGERCNRTAWCKRRPVHGEGGRGDGERQLATAPRACRSGVLSPPKAAPFASPAPTKSRASPSCGSAFSTHGQVGHAPPCRGPASWRKPVVSQRSRKPNRCTTVQPRSGDPMGVCRDWAPALPPRAARCPWPRPMRPARTTTTEKAVRPGETRYGVESRPVMGDVAVQGRSRGRRVRSGAAGEMTKRR